MISNKIVVDKENLIHNINTLKNTVNTRVIAVLKGNGYGLGIINMAEVLRECEVDFFAVSDYEEALCLRENGFTDESILLLTPVYNEETVTQMVENNITLSVESYENAKVYSLVAERLDKQITCHIKLDTGMGRFGYQSCDKEEIVKTMKFSNIDFEGIYSHFSCAFEKKYNITKKQFEEFNKIINYLESFEFEFKIKHIANSSAALRFPETRLDAVRLGSALLGRLPVAPGCDLKRIAYMESEVLSVRTLKANQNIGYGNTYKTKGVTDTAIIPVGYNDGYMVEKANDTFRLIDVLRYMFNNLKSIGKKTFVEINGEKARVIGRVGMYNIVADVTGMNVKIGDKVKLSINPILADSDIIREFRS